MERETNKRKDEDKLAKQEGKSMKKGEGRELHSPSHQRWENNVSDYFKAGEGGI